MSSLTLEKIEVPLTPDLKEFISAELSSGRYKSAGEMVCQALTLLKTGEEDYLRFRDEVRARLARMDAGEGLVLEGTEALAAYFEDVKARGRQRYENRKNAP